MTRFYSSIFSTIGEQSNEYVYIFMIQYAMLFVNKKITLNDEYYVMCDLDTYSIIKNIPMLKDVRLIPMSKPKTQEEGQRWVFFDHEATYVGCCGSPKDGHYYFTNMLEALLR